MAAGQCGTDALAVLSAAALPDALDPLITQVAHPFATTEIHKIERHDRLGGLVHEYQQVA